MNEIVQIVAKRLRDYRIQRGYTQEMLAEKAGLHNTYIGQVERGEKNITLVSLEKILNALNVDFFRIIQWNRRSFHRKIFKLSETLL